MKNSLLVLFSIIIFLIIGSITLTVLLICKKDRRAFLCAISIPVYIVTLITLVVTGMCYRTYNNYYNLLISSIPDETTEIVTHETEPSIPEETDAVTTPSKPQPTLVPYCDELSDPANRNITYTVKENEQPLQNYQREEPILFPDSTHYNDINGILTHLENNHRTASNFGTVNITEEMLTLDWVSDPDIGNIVGQPLIVQWSQSTQQQMNIYSNKKAKTGLIEIICFTKDGTILFYDLDDGTPTRSPIDTGMVLDGKASIDPRGYPLLYIGSSNVTSGQAPHMRIISLIDGRTLYTKSGADTDANRKWYALNFAPLICADSDTLIWPCASGIIYTIKLNTRYNKSAGTISVQPDNIVKLVCNIDTPQTFGWDSDPIIVGNCLYITDRSGLLMCIDLNSMNIIWAQDIKGRSHFTPTFVWETNNQGYLYTTSQNKNGKSYILKIDARNGNILWEQEISADITFSSIHIGKNNSNLDGLIIMITKASAESAKLIALSASSGEIVWERAQNENQHSFGILYDLDSQNAYIVSIGATGIIQFSSWDGKSILSEITTHASGADSVTIFNNHILLIDRDHSLFTISVE